MHAVACCIYQPDLIGRMAQLMSWLSAGIDPATRPVGPVRRLLVSLVRRRALEPHGRRLDRRDRPALGALAAQHPAQYHGPPEAAERALEARPHLWLQAAPHAAPGGRAVDPQGRHAAPGEPAVAQQEPQDGAGLAGRRRRGPRGRHQPEGPGQMETLRRARPLHAVPLQAARADRRPRRARAVGRLLPHEPKVRQQDPRGLQARRRRHRPRLQPDAAPEHAAPARPSHVHRLLPALALPEQRVPALPAAAQGGSGGRSGREPRGLPELQLLSPLCELLHARARLPLR